MRRTIWILIVALFLTSCSGGNGTKTPTSDPAMVMTSVKLTVDANSTTMIGLTPSATISPTPTETTVPVTPTETTTQGLTSSPTFTMTVNSSSPDKAELVSQSVSDNTVLTPGQTFDITWTFKNTGTTTWTTDYSVKFWSDELMGAAQSTNFSTSVEPGKTLDITMHLTAPTKIGTAKSSWWLQTAEGTNFYPFYVIIVVAAAPTSTITPTFTITPTTTITSTLTTNP
jgi:hypothetical protein